MRSKPSDEYLTPPQIAKWVAKLGPWDFDPWGHDQQLVKVAEKATFIRQGAKWPTSGKIWANPPYSCARLCVRQLAQWYTEAPEERTVLALVVAAPGSAYWSEFVWPYAVVVFPPRIKFWRLNEERLPAPTFDSPTRDLAFLLWTKDRDLREKFVSDARAGRIISRVALEPVACLRAGGR